MNLIDIILQLIKQFNLVPTDKYKALVKDCNDWEDNANVDSDDKIKQMYAKSHQGIWLRLINAFVFFFLRAEFAKFNQEEEDPFK